MTQMTRLHVPLHARALSGHTSQASFASFQPESSTPEPPYRGRPSFANYVQKACHCRPFYMCPFCRKWLKPTGLQVDQ